MKTYFDKNSINHKEFWLKIKKVNYKKFSSKAKINIITKQKADDIYKTYIKFADNYGTIF